MRDYGKVAPTFWTGETGRDLRRKGPEVQLVALYLMTCQSSHMSGVYYMPLPVLIHETGIPLEGACKALLSLSEGGFAHYDEASEVVWVPEMARYQIGEKLSQNDNRHKGILKYLELYRKSRFYKDFYARYREDFNLPKQAPCKPLLRGRTRTRAEQEQEQEQSNSSETAKPSSEPPALLIFPTHGETKTWNLYPEKVAELAEAFPTLDILAECKKSLAWTKANPRKRKTPTGMGRFLFDWMARTQNRAGASHVPPSRDAPSPESDADRDDRIRRERAEDAALRAKAAANGPVRISDLFTEKQQ